MKKTWTTRHLTLLSLLSALVILLSVTPLGYLRIGMLSITLNMIPVGVAAIVLGPLGGAVTGAVFGLTSFASAMTGGSPLLVILLGIHPVLTFIQCFLPRFLMGLTVGLVYRWLQPLLGRDKGCYLVGFLSAFLNTVFFMTALVLMFGNTEYLQSLMGGQNVLLFMCTYVGINAVLEMGCATVIVGVLGRTLEKAHILGR